MSARVSRGFPWWLIFIPTCFFSWLSVLVAGLQSRNLKWVLMGVIYAIPFFVEYVHSSKYIFKEKERVENLFVSGNEISHEDSVKYGNVLVPLLELYNLKEKTYYSDVDFDTMLVDKQIAQLEDRIAVELREANPEIAEALDFQGTWLVVLFFAVFASIFHAIKIRKPYAELMRDPNRTWSFGYKPRPTSIEEFFDEDDEDDYDDEDDSEDYDNDADTLEEDEYAVDNSQEYKYKVSDDKDDNVISDMPEYVSKQHTPPPPPPISANPTPSKPTSPKPAVRKKQVDSREIDKLRQEIKELNRKISKEDSSRKLKKYRQEIERKENKIRELENNNQGVKY